MAYDRATLVRSLYERLRASPWLTQSQLSGALGIHRHTLRRALAEQGWQSFAESKRAAVLDAVEEQLRDQPSVTLKEVWARLGCPNASTFARFVRATTGSSPMELRRNYSLGHVGQKWDKMAIDMRGGVDRL